MSYDLLLSTGDPGRVLDMQQIERALADVVGIATSPEGWVYSEPPNIKVAVDVSEALESGRIYVRADDEGGEQSVERGYRLALLLSHRLGLEAVDTRLNQPIDMANLAGAQDAVQRAKRVGEGAFGDIRAPAPSRMRVPSADSGQPSRPVRTGGGSGFAWFLLLVGVVIFAALAVPVPNPEAKPVIVLLGVLTLIAIWMIARSVNRG